MTARPCRTCGEALGSCGRVGCAWHALAVEDRARAARDRAAGLLPAAPLPDDVRLDSALEELMPGASLRLPPMPGLWRVPRGRPATPPHRTPAPRRRVHLPPDRGSHADRQ